MPRLRVSILGFFLLLSHVACGDVFNAGETVCFLGDSITHGGRFHSYVYDYYLTRFPDRTIRFVNAGVSGDSAGGALTRLDEDVIRHKPTSVVIMFGMNDVGRGSYVADPDAQKKAAQASAMERYKKNMGLLVARLGVDAGAPRLLFVTPSPFDQTAVNDRGNNQPGCNDGLGLCAAFVRELAGTQNGTVVDFHAPMTAFNLERQKSDPAYTIVGGDRVHPGAAGHLMMAWLFLKAQGAPALVSRVAVDAASGKAEEGVNAAVTGVVQAEGAWRFDVLEKALPFPVDPAARDILKQLPVERDLNQEIVAVRGLAAGAYELRIDGGAVGRYRAEELAEGVNVAFNEAAPQVKQAQKVAALNEARRSAETVLRDYAAVRWFLKNRGVNPDDASAVTLFAETKMNKSGYYEGKVPDYLKNWPARDVVCAKVAELERQARAASTPAPHVYEVRPVR